MTSQKYKQKDYIIDTNKIAYLCRNKTIKIKPDGYT